MSVLGMEHSFRSHAIRYHVSLSMASHIFYDPFFSSVYELKDNVVRADAVEAAEAKHLAEMSARVDVYIANMHARNACVH